MIKPNGYDEAQAFTGEFETIKLGGHVCKIIDARVEKTRANNKDMLVVAFDIAEGENKEFYKRRFEQSKQFNPEAKWQGVHRVMLEDNEGKCNKWFKGFITSVEASNPNFKWDWEEKNLKGKLFGAVFGKEQYCDSYGELKFATKIRFIRSKDNVKDAPIPEDKLLNTSSSNEIGEIIPVNNDDLPF